jgi:hypothetical protein
MDSKRTKEVHPISRKRKYDNNSVGLTTDGVIIFFFASVLRQNEEERITAKFKRRKTSENLPDTETQQNSTSSLVFRVYKTLLCKLYKKGVFELAFLYPH